MKGINLAIALWGMKGAGKTTMAQHILQRMQVKKPYMKQLVVDTRPHPSYADWKEIPLQYIPAWKSGRYRIWREDPEKVFYMVAKHLTNAIVVWEDATKYMGERLDKTVNTFLVDAKQANVDHLFLFHGHNDEPYKLVRKLEGAILMATKNYPTDKDRWGSQYMEVLRSQHQVNREHYQFKQTGMFSTGESACPYIINPHTDQPHFYKRLDLQ